MDWWQSVDIYCERLSADWGAEPVNTLSNIGFFIAAWLAARLFKNHALTLRQAPDLAGMIGFLFLVSLGSALFHHTGMYLAMLADIIPIMCFMYLGVGSAARRVLRFGWLYVALALGVFAGVSIAMGKIQLPGLAPGTMSYVPAALTILLVGLGAWRKGSVAARPILWAAPFFAGGLFMRSVDAMWCGAFPLGTHFMWHLLDAVAAYLILKGLMAHVKRTA